MFYNCVCDLQRDGEVEKVENAARQARLKGSSVRYGDTIQLQHTLTGRYIGVSTTQTSVTESSKLKVRCVVGNLTETCIERAHCRQTC